MSIPARLASSLTKPMTLRSPAGRQRVGELHRRVAGAVDQGARAPWRAAPGAPRYSHFAPNRLPAITTTLSTQ